MLFEIQGGHFVQHQRQSSTPSGDRQQDTGGSPPPGVLAAGARHGFSVSATRVAWMALLRGNGAMAQFSHPELGGLGQWVRGGMTMVGDMFNHGLAARVDALCTELSQVIAAQPQGTYESGAALPPWWPADWEAPAVVGEQDDHAYAWFPERRRLAIRRGDQVDVFDSAELHITGVAQQQGSTRGLAFSSPQGPVDLKRLRRVPSDDDAQTEPAGLGGPADHGPEQTFDTLTKLARLHQQGVLTDEEFQAKKKQLLARL